MADNTKLIGAVVVLVLVVAIGSTVFSVSGNVAFAAIMAILVGLIGIQTLKFVSASR
jgi:sensor histidine kinase regulating citrate/malate metabolism